MADPKDKLVHENHIYIFTVVMVLVAFLAVWFAYKPQIVGFLVYTKGILIIPLWWIHSLFKAIGLNYVPLLSELVYSTEHLCKPTNNWLPLFCQNKFSEVTIFQISKASQAWNLLIFLLATPWIKKAYDRFNSEHPARGFIKSMNLEEFIEEQIPNQRHLQVFGPLDLSKYDTNNGHFKALDSTYEFANRNELITGTKERLVNITINGITKEYNDKSETVPIIDEEKFLNVLRAQLGDLWITLDSSKETTPDELSYLSDVDTILLALYLPVACATDESMDDEEFRKIKKDSTTLINYYWDICTKNIPSNPLFTIENQYVEGDRKLVGFNFDFLRKRIHKYIKQPVATKIFKNHAYVRTILCEVVLTARQLGVMPPTDIRWLKLYNRTAYAFIQNIGRPSLFSEGLGPISHYLIEVKLGKPLEEPDFNIGLVGFEYELLSFAMTEARQKAAEDVNSIIRVVEFTDKELNNGSYNSKNNYKDDFKYSDDHVFDMVSVEIPQDEIQKNKQKGF